MNPRVELYTSGRLTHTYTASTLEDAHRIANDARATGSLALVIYGRGTK